MATKYALKEYNNDKMARGRGRGMPISFKQSIEICSFLRKRKVSDAKAILQRVLKEEQAIPFKRFNKDVGHKPGKIAGGRYPKKASQEFLDLLNSVEANAQFKGLNTANLVITHIIANKATTTRRYGRQRSRSAKRTNIEMIVEERAEEKKAQAKEQKPEVKKEAAPKQEKKVEEKKPEQAKVETKKPVEKPAEVKEQPKAQADQKKEAPAQPKQESKSPEKPAKAEAKKEEKTEDKK